ncbi:hypothetical protein EXIGLDRAFT_772191 [Exidia glandulosa HHB12029]|uniref:Uncharacterized protein n=1 Tax=Exidia glandulosa HHB12029 TaxID=1314781 RepID=A0A165FGU6_EXIGL|nr:hypothetical protein EXIGLDRAFT_772191 [Exidia glandulosa HHB12029]
MPYARPAHFDDFQFATCTFWADRIRRAMFAGAEFPAYAPASYDDFHAVNPTVISSARGNSAINDDIAHRQQEQDAALRRVDSRIAQEQHERDNDRLSIPVAALKIFLDHDTTVARMHTEQIQATTRTPQSGQRAWFDRRMKRGAARRNYGPRPFRPQQRFRGFDTPRPPPYAPPQTPRQDVPMREPTPAAAPLLQTLFGNPEGFFGANANASGSGTPIDNYDYDYEMEDVTGPEQEGSAFPTTDATTVVQSDTGSVTDAVASLGLGPDTRVGDDQVSLA